MQTEIVPVAVFPGTATRFYLQAGNLGPPPSYYYELQTVTLIPANGAEPAREELTVLKTGNAMMTEAQWSAWPADADDDEYQLNALTQNLGLVRA